MYVRMYVCTYVRMYVCMFSGCQWSELTFVVRILLRTSSATSATATSILRAKVIRTQASIGISVERCGLVILVRIGAPSLPAEPKPKTLNLHPTP